MAADVRLRIVDPAREVVVVDAWIGGNATRDRVHEVVARPPDFIDAGFQRWGSIQPAEARSIAETHYASGATPVDVDRWLARYPATDDWWMVEIDD